MWIAPLEFELPRRIEGGWQIDEFQFDENPRYTVPRRIRRLVEVWSSMRLMARGVMGQGAPVMPRAGGYFDQPAMIMEAFAMFDRWVEQRKQGSDD